MNKVTIWATVPMIFKKKIEIDDDELENLYDDPSGYIENYIDITNVRGCYDIDVDSVDVDIDVH